jgi:hypothetical protein
MSKLTKQCDDYGLPIEVIPGTRVQGSKKLWVNKDGIGVPPELIALNYYESKGYQASWCEGKTLFYLMKVASFSIMSDYKAWATKNGNDVVWHSSKIQLHDDREYCKRTVSCILFEALCLMFADHHTEIVNGILTTTTKEIEKYSTEHINLNSLYSCVKVENVIALWRAVGSDLLAKIARIFVKGNYEYRSGWPDLILIRGKEIKFVEVKTTDLFHANQIRIINSFAKPLNLPFSVAHIVPWQ